MVNLNSCNPLVSLILAPSLTNIFSGHLTLFWASGRPLVQLAFPSKLKQPRSSFVTIGSSYALHSSQKMGKPDLLLPPPPKFEKLPLTNTEDEIPEILCSSSTPTASIKNASPNSKRVSPPHSDFGTSPNLRSGRRLILQSIPSFPSLTPQH